MTKSSNIPNRELDTNPQNRDPISGEPGAHPIGTGLGAAGAASAGAVLGAAAGPVGSVAGAVVGAIAGGIFGGLAGSGIAELVNPTEELQYWEQNFTTRPYVSKGDSFETYKPAYKYGYESRAANPDRNFDAVRSELQSNWQTNKTNLDWTKAEPAIRDSYERTGNEYMSKLNKSNNSGANSGNVASADSKANSTERKSPAANASGYGAGVSGAYSSKNNSGNNNAA